MQLDVIKKHEDRVNVPKHDLALPCSTSPATHMYVLSLYVGGIYTGIHKLMV